jgi:NADH-quinone oxidoreductase subunit G
LGLNAFEYQRADEVRDEVRRACADSLASAYGGQYPATEVASTAPIVDVPMYHVDALVRRAPSLQRTREGRATPAIYE